MKSAKKISFKLLVSLVIMTLFSSGKKSDKASEISKIIQTNSKVEQLPFAENKAFKAGEVLTYRMHYGMLNAGIAVLEVKPNLIEVSGRKVYHVVGSGYTIGSTDWFFKVRDRYESYIDKDAMLPWLFVRRVDEGGYKFSQDYAFNHYTKKVDVGNNEKYDVPVGIQDMVSAFYSSRNLDLSHAKPGDLFSITCFVDKEIWPLKIKFIGKETIETDIGKYRCLKFRPIVQKGRVFKKEDDLNVWISDDDNHLPMRVKADVLIGSIKMDITSAKNLANPTSKVD